MSAKFKDFIYRYRNLLLFIAYAAISISIMIHHEPFRDEMNTWAVLNNVPTGNLPHDLTRGGHPLIYYLFWLPFAKIGLPFVFYRIAAWLACLAAAFLFIFHSPFSFATKTLAAFSTPMIYWYPSIARCYSFVPAVFFSLAWLSPKIKDRKSADYGILIILFCLIAGIVANIHLIYGMLGGAVFITLAWKKIRSGDKFSRHEIIAASLLSLLLAVPAVQTFMAFSVNDAYVESIRISPVEVLEVIIRNLSCNWQSYEFLSPPTRWMPYYAEDTFFATTLFSLLGLCAILLKTSPCIFFIFAAGFIYHFAVYTTKYPVFMPYRIFTFETMLIACLWAAAMLEPEKYANKKRAAEMLLAILLFPAAISGAEMCHADWVMPFTPDMAMAEYADRNIQADGNAKIYITDSASLTGVSFYSRKHVFYDPDGNPVVCLVHLGKRMNYPPETKPGQETYIIDKAYADGADRGNLTDKSHAEKMFCSYKGIIGPAMCIYRING